MSAVEGSLSFATDIRPLFRSGDRAAMESAFDLWSYDDVVSHAEAILGAVESGSMPCDGEWPEENVAILRSWIESGKPA
jgi:hypothetical protein